MSFTNKNKKNIVNKIFSFATIALISVSVFTTNIPVNAQLGLEPFGINKSDPKETGWFKYVVNPGDTIEDFVVISNVGTDDTNVDLRSNDALTTEDGAFTIVSNELPNKEVGKWVQLKENIISLPAQKAIKVPFKINIPSDAKPGEYAGGLSITEVDKSTDGSAPVSVKTRVGNRIYLIVKGDLNVSSNVKDLEIVNPRTTNFSDELRRRAFIKPENVVFKITTENTGNIYTTLKGKFKINQPDGKVVEQSFARNLSPRDGVRIYYIETQLPYQKGKTDLQLDYTTIAQNEPKDPSAAVYKYTNDKGTLNYTLNLTDEDLAAFKLATEKPVTANAPKPVVANRSNLVTEAKPETPQANAQPTEKIVTQIVPADNSLVTYIGLGVGLLLLILIGLVGYKVYSDNQNKKPAK